MCMNECVIESAQLYKPCIAAGRSLHFASTSGPRTEPRYGLIGLRVNSGNTAEIQCLLDTDSNDGGSFSWTGPAVTSGRAVVTLDSSGTVSTLTINGVGRSDEGRYNCSFTGVNTISINLDVRCKLPKLNFIDA